MNEFLTYQIIIFGFCAIQVLRSLLRLLKSKIDIREFLLAVVIWSAFATLGLFPNLSTVIGNHLGFELGINFLLVSAVLFLLFSTFRQSLENEKNNSKFTKLVRHLAIEEFRKDCIG